MTKHQSSLVNMFDKTVAICDRMESHWTANTAFRESYLAIREEIEALPGLMLEPAINITGYTDVKTGFRQQLQEEGYTLAATLYAYGLSQKDEALMNTADITKSQFVKASGKALIGMVSVLADAAGPHLDALTPMGFDTARLASIREISSRFSEQADNPKLLRSQKRKANEKLTTAIEKIRRALRNELDVYARSLQWQQREFARSYFLARRPRKPPFRKLSLRLRLVDAAGAPVEGVSAQVLPDKVKGRSSAKGGLRFRHLKPGNSKLKLSKEGYAEQVLNIAIVQGVRLDMEVVMQAES